jgi:hypothetical protein
MAPNTTIEELEREVVKESERLTVTLADENK